MLIFTGISLSNPGTLGRLLIYYCDSIHSNNPDKASYCWPSGKALDEGAFTSRPRKKPFISLVSLTSNTPQNNMAALEKKFFGFLLFLLPTPPKSRHPVDAFVKDNQTS
jgi:hypothetical protein